MATVAVVGAGPGGLAAAIGLRQQGLSAHVFERTCDPQWAGAGIQLGPNAMHVLRHLGCAASVQKVACEPQAVTLRQYDTGKSLLSIPMGERCRQRYGAAYLTVHRADLLQVLHDLAQDTGVQLHRGKAVRSYEQATDGVRPLLDKGADLVSDLLVAADGIHSRIRPAMPGASRPVFAGKVVWRGLVPAAAVQGDPLPMHVHAWLGPHRHFVAYYLRGGSLLNFIAIQERDHAVAQTWTGPGDIVELRRVFAGWDDRVSAILEACQQCLFGGLFEQPPLPHWSDGRVVLLGDACHPMLPFQAQGAAMAIEDAHVLAQQCGRLMRRGGFGDGQLLARMLADYERLRKPRTTRMQVLSLNNGLIYHAATPGARWRRNCMLRIAQLWPTAVLRARLDPVYGFDVTTAQMAA